jgi:ABC-type antimicrobial peptide transport system permease subunit
MIAKVILNFFLGGGFSIPELFIAIVVGFFMLTGMEYVNYAAAAILALGFVTHLHENIMHLSRNWFFLLEGFADVGCAVLLMILPPVKEHFTNKWNEFPDIFKK